mgnify:CR=1 FL=1
MDNRNRKQQICILGSTGSIGTQALEVIAEHDDLYEVYCLTAYNQVELLAEQARRFKSDAVVIANEAHYERLCSLLNDCPDIKVYAGAKALDEIVQADPIDMVLTAMVGFAGLTPTVNAIKARKKICLANKETLVVAGEIIMNLAQQNRCPILPVDSEHSAIFQSLVGDECNEIEKILLTASGGPFRTFSLEQMQSVTAADALRHPTWDMGAKITIDSASMMNKGFEVIEAALKTIQGKAIVNSLSLKEGEELFLDDAVDMIEELPANVVARVMKAATAETKAKMKMKTLSTKLPTTMYLLLLALRMLSSSRMLKRSGFTLWKAVL